MSGRVKRHVLCLQMLNRTKNTKLRKAILEYADADLISALCECAHNILRGTVRLTPREKVRLRKYKDKLRLIANRRLSISRRRREIQQHGGGFLPALLAPLAITVFLPLLRQMAHMRKMALVDPRLLETLRTPIQPPIDTNLRDLDSEMTSILDKTGIDVSEKVRLYNQALLRYNDMAKMSTTKPTPVVVVKEKETPPTTYIMGEVVTTLPKALQEKGRQLVSRLKTTQWNDRGELLHEGVVVPGSNVVDLVHDLLRKRKTSDPIGWQQFGSQMRAANIPMELVGNVARRRHIQQRKRTLTPKQKKGRRVQLPDDWESY